MNIFKFLPYFAFTISILMVACSTPTFLMNEQKASPLSTDEKVQQTVKTLNAKPISTVIQKWGRPHGLSDDDAGSRVYIWQIPAREFLSTHDSGNFSRHTKVVTKTTEKLLPTDEIYELIFYTQPDGVIYKINTKKDIVSAISFDHNHTLK
ncbi:MAG: hypothetical protein OXI67_10670 [Candidatus Poribacteria bacterium]|nr:hypothetical protein [Candidatus Poribacteria bacterium]